MSQLNKQMRALDLEPIPDTAETATSLGDTKSDSDSEDSDYKPKSDEEEFKRRLLGALPLLVPRPGSGYKRYHEELWPPHTRLYVNPNCEQARAYFERPEALRAWQRKIGKPKFPDSVFALGKLVSKLFLFSEEEDSEDSSSSEQTKSKFQ